MVSFFTITLNYSEGRSVFNLFSIKETHNYCFNATINMLKLLRAYFVFHIHCKIHWQHFPVIKYRLTWIINWFKTKSNINLWRSIIIPIFFCYYWHSERNAKEIKTVKSITHNNLIYSYVIMFLIVFVVILWSRTWILKSTFYCWRKKHIINEMRQRFQICCVKTFFLFDTSQRCHIFKIYKILSDFDKYKW